jgi:hypothetical protein
MIAVISYCFMVNEWEEKLTNQIKRVYDSGLYESANELYLFVTDTTNTLKDKLDSIMSNYPKYIVEYTNTNFGEGIMALNKVDELCRLKDDYKILYFHTKGVFNKYKNFNTKEISDLKLDGVITWVEMLEYFLIDNWKECVAKLDDHDTVGVTNNGNWWWGNFWWTRSSYVQKNIPFNEYYNGSRWSCEAWLHESNNFKENIKPYEMFHFEWDPYYTVIPNYFYDGTSLSDLEIEIIDAKFGYFAEQRDEGTALGVIEDRLTDVTEIVKNIINDDKSKISIVCNNETFNCDPSSGLPNSTRIKFKTNIDNNEYVITSFPYFAKIQIGNVKNN